MQGLFNTTDRVAPDQLTTPLNKLPFEIPSCDLPIESGNTLCKTLSQLINNCTADHLGKCYHENHVEAIKREQKIVAR